MPISVFAGCFCHRIFLRLLRQVSKNISGLKVHRTCRSTSRATDIVFDIATNINGTRKDTVGEYISLLFRVIHDGRVIDPLSDQSSCMNIGTSEISSSNAFLFIYLISPLSIWDHVNYLEVAEAFCGPPLLSMHFGHGLEVCRNLSWSSRYLN